MYFDILKDVVVMLIIIVLQPGPGIIIIRFMVQKKLSLILL
jgi:hypothetical protein